MGMGMGMGMGIGILYQWFFRSLLAKRLDVYLHSSYRVIQRCIG